MKKVSFYALSLLSLLALSACMPAKQTQQRKKTPSSLKASKSSPSTKESSKRSSSSSEEDEDYSTSSSSNTRKDPNAQISLIDQGEALEALGDIPEIPKWAEFKTIKVESLIGSAGPTPSTKDEVVSKMGPADSDMGSGGFWRGTDYSILISFSDQGAVTTKTASLPNPKKISSLKDVEPGMSAQEVVAKHGRPETIAVFGHSTVFGWEGQDGKDYSVMFDQDKVYQITEP